MKPLKAFILSLLFVALLSMQLISTSLRITVSDKLGNMVEGAVVKLYETEEDYNKNENALEGDYVTDKKGRLTIKELKAQLYYIDIVKDDMNNNLTGVKVGPLESGRINKSLIIIEE